MANPRFRIRDALPGDADYIIAAFDSALPFLSSIGSAAQWGTTPLSEIDGFSAQRVKSVESSVTYQATGTGDPVRVYIIEALSPSPSYSDSEGDGGEREGEYVPVGSSTLHEEFFPGYVTCQKHLSDIIREAKNFLFIEVLITDFRVGNHLRKGAGAELVRHAVEYAREKGKSAVYVDCWAGNGRKLTR